MGVVLNFDDLTENFILYFYFFITIIFIFFSSGHFGLWLDEGFYHGSSFKCRTFNNEPLASTEDFIIFGVEVWGFEGFE